MYKVISTFSGGGGSSCGYKLAGCNVIAAVEFLENQAKTYRANNPNTKLYVDDIRNIDCKTLMTDLNLKVGELDILDGSPPCSSFSTAGKRHELWGKEKQYSSKVQRTDDLFFEYIRFVRELQPKVFVAENVSGLIKGSSKGMFNIFFKAFKDCGYKVKAKVLNASNYGVPQIRQRVFFVGVRNDLNIEPSFPIPQKEKINLLTAFEGLEHTGAELKDADCSKYAIYQQLVPLKNGESSIKYFNLVKSSPFKPANTLTQSAKTLGAASICHWDNRKFTVKEAKRITSFPDDYILPGKYEDGIEACGRSAPPLMMKAIAENIQKNILGKIKHG